MNRSLMGISAAFLVLVLLSLPVSADRSVATEHTAIIDKNDYTMGMLSTENGKDVTVWIEEIEGMDGNSSHPVDVYIATSDQKWDHMCDGEGNMFAEEFNPVYYKEPVSPEDLPFTFSYTVSSDDYYYIIIDNCDNQREGDYANDLSSIRITYAIDDQTDENLEAAGDFLAGLGIVTLGAIAFCCGLPVVLLVLLLRRNKTQVIVQAPMGQPQAMMGQPQAMMGQPQVVATGAANPAAMNYYNSMLQQGYDPNTALAWTVQSYPGWHP